MADRIFNLPQTRGSFEMAGKVTGTQRSNFYNEKETKSGAMRRVLSFGVQTSNENTFYVDLAGMPRDKVYFFRRADKDKGIEKDKKEVAWKDRMTYVAPEGYDMIGVKVGVTKKTNESGKVVNDNKTLTDFDAAKEISENLHDGDNVYLLAQAALKTKADRANADAEAAGQIQMNLRDKEIKEAEADAAIAQQKKMVELAAKEAEVRQQKLDAEVRKQADADLYKRQKEAEAKKYEAERSAESAKFAKEQEAEGIRMVGMAEAEAIKQKGLAEAEAMLKKAEAYKQYNGAAMGEMIIKILPSIAAEVAKPLASIDKVSIIGSNANGVSEISGNVPAVMAQTFEAVREATGIDMKEIVRANSYDAKVTKNVNLVSDSTIVSEKNGAQDAE